MHLKSLVGNYVGCNLLYSVMCGARCYIKHLMSCSLGCVNVQVLEGSTDHVMSFPKCGTHGLGNVLILFAVESLCVPAVVELLFLNEAANALLTL